MKFTSSQWKQDCIDFLERKSIKINSLSHKGIIFILNGSMWYDIYWFDSDGNPKLSGFPAEGPIIRLFDITINSLEELEKQIGILKMQEILDA